MPDPIAPFGGKSPTPTSTSTRLSRVCGVAFIFSVFIVADTASAQGPLRRLGDRIRERAVGPNVPGTNNPANPATPASPLGRRPLIGRPQPNAPAAGNPANRNPAAGQAQAGQAQAGQTQAATRGQAGSPRSANYNRASATAQRMADPSASRVEQSSAWQARQDFRGSAAEPISRQPQSVARSAESISSPRPIDTPPSRARLGVVVDTPETITPAGLPPRRPRGALVSEVQTDSAAEVAGIAVGDLIVGVDGRVITSVRDLTDQLSGYEPGDEARFQITRDEQLLTADVTLAGPDGIAPRRPESKGSQRSSNASPSIINGLGAAIGGLFSSPADGGAAATAPRAPVDNAENSPAISPETVRNSLPESLPPPAPEKDPN